MKVGTSPALDTFLVDFCETKGGQCGFQLLQ